MGFLSDKERAQHSPAEDLLAKPDRFGMLKEEYLRDGADPSNLRYGYVRRTQ